MKVERPNKKRERTLLVGIVGVVMLLILGVWGVQLWFFAQEADLPKKAVSSTWQDTETVAQDILEQSPFANQDFRATLEEMRQALREQTAHKQAVETVTTGVVERLEAGEATNDAAVASQTTKTEQTVNE